ncbi:MAG: c-type cytochrome biogenesis protein CcmI [Betaproteobacteria bacterium]
MVTFLIFATLMVGGALAFLLTPLLKNSSRLRAGTLAESDLVALYRQQIGEVQADVDAGLLPRAQLAEAVTELEHRMLIELPHRPTHSQAQRYRSRPSAVLLLLILPLAAGLLYWKLGSPGALSADGSPGNFAHPSAHSTNPDQVETMVARLADKLAANPDNPEGWAMLARSYGVLGKHADAVSAFARAVALLPDDADLLADYADALAITMNGQLKGKPLQLVHRALKLDPDNPKALALAGSEAFDRKDYRGAVSFWQRAVRSAPQGTEFGDSLRASLKEAGMLAGGGAAILPSRPATAEPIAAPGRVSGRVVLAGALAANVLPGDTVFIYAQAPDGPRMPLAILTAKAKDLPLDFVLDDSLSMSPEQKLSSVQRVLVTARISRTASAMPQPGDLRGRIGPVGVGAREVHIEINEIVN